MVSRQVSKEASAAEDKQLRDYELVLVISPEVEEDKLGAIINNVSQFVTGHGGTISNLERWGKRKLAYQIRHFTEGNYVLAQFKMKPALSRGLEANLQISEEVLRYLLIRLSSQE